MKRSTSVLTITEDEEKYKYYPIIFDTYQSGEVSLFTEKHARKDYMVFTLDQARQFMTRIREHLGINYCHKCGCKL
jgi:hypothetical protein